MEQQPPSVPTDAEISERSQTIVIPPLSRYAGAQQAPQGPQAVDPEAQPERAGDGPHPADSARVVGPEPASPAPHGVPRTSPLMEGPARRAAEIRRQVEAQRASGSLPVPASPPLREETGERVPFWKRIAMYRPAAQSHGPSEQALQALTARLAQVERQLTAHEEKLGRRLDSFEENITRLWEIEEQMSLNELREKLAFLQANQEEIADGLHALGRNAAILTGVLVVIAAGTAFALARLM